MNILIYVLDGIKFISMLDFYQTSVALHFVRYKGKEREREREGERERDIDRERERERERESARLCCLAGLLSPKCQHYIYGDILQSISDWILSRSM